MAEACSSVGASRAFKQLNNNDKLNILQNTKAANTKNATKTWLKCFNDYLRVKKLGNIIEEISMDDLANTLYEFWVDIVPTETSTNKKTGDNNKKMEYHTMQTPL